MPGPWDDFAEVDDKPTQEAGPWQDYAPKADSGRPSGPWDDFAKAEKRPGFLSTIGQAGLKGLKEGVSETADVVDPFKDRPQAPDSSYIGKILEKPVSEGWSDPNWWAAHIAYGGAKSAPSLAAGAAGAFAGSTVGPVGTLAGGAAGFGLGSVIQTLAPAYQRARQDGLEHDEAVTRAMEQAGISGAFGAAMGLAPGAAVLGRTAEGALKRPISEALAQIFGVQPAIGAGQQVATGATEGRMPTAGELATGYAENVGLGTAITGAHAGLRRLTAAEAPGLAAEEHPVPPGGAQTAPEGAPESVPRDHQVGYDLETNTFKVVGPEGETVKTGFSDDAQAEAEARRMDHAAPIDAAANEAVEPTQAQAEAGNYQKGHLNLHGMDIAVETPKGAMRRGVGPDGEPWENESPAHYGYLKRTEGADGEHVDTYVGPHPESERAFVVDQIDPETGKFDEHKAILGARTLEEARAIYDAGFSDGSGPARRAAIAEMPVREFRRWLKEGDTKTDIAPQVEHESLNANEDHQLNETPRDWADIAVPLAAKEVGADLTPWQHHQALALVRNGMDSTEAVKRVTDIPFHVPKGWDAVGEPFDRDQIYNDLRARLDKRGLKDTALGVVDVVKDALGNERPGAAGSWSGVRNLIQVALGYSEHAWVLDHETVHALRGMRLFEPHEWKMLEDSVGKMPDTMRSVEERYGDRGLSDAQKLEEGIAETFARWQNAKMAERREMQERTGLGGTLGRLMGKIRDLMRGVKDWWRGNNLRSPDEVFGAMESGRIGARERGAREAGAFNTGYEPTMLNPEAPRVGEEGRNPMDATSDAIAEAVGGKGAGTYDRAMDRLRPKKGSELKNLNPVENFTIFPDTLAKTDKMFARLWNAWKGRERAEHTHITGWRELIPELRNAKRGDPDVQKAYAAIELHAINREKAMPGEKVRVRNVDTKKATKSKPGEDYTLTPRQEKIYHELNALHDAEWDTMMKATAEKYGWKGAPTAAALANAARGATKSEARQLGRLAELLHMMAQQKQQVYFPRSRFGDTYISVKPKAGQEKDSLGGFPELSHFETVERPWSQDVLGKSGRPDVSKRIAELRKEYPEATHEIETGLLQKRPDMLRRLDIPAVEKLLALTEHKARQVTSAKMKAREGLTADEAKAMAKEENAAFKDDMLDTLRDVMYQEMKSGFKKKARIVPGYCVAPETRLLTADMRWVTASSVAVGDELVGFDEHPVNGFHRKMRASKIIDIRRIMQPRLKITLRSGRQITVSAEHNFVAHGKSQKRPTEWMAANKLKIGSRLKPFPMENYKETYAAGWLAGFIDGDGCLFGVSRSGKTSSLRMGWTQLPGFTFDHSLRVAADLCIPVRLDRSSKAMHATTTSWDAMRALQMIRPARLVEGRRWIGCPLPMVEPDEVVDISDAGDGAVVAIKTTTSTFISEGICSHNSSDFDRSVGTHMHQMARHAADLAHREGIDRAYQDIQDKHEHETTKKWVRDWRQFQDDPNTPLGRAANGASQIGYVWTLAMNPSSTLVNLFDIPQSAIPSLAVGNGLRASLAHMGPALAEAYRHTTFNLKQGAHIALEKLGRTPDERAFIQALKNDGSIHSVSVDDMRELGGRQAEAYGEIKSTMRRAMDIATSNMSVMDQANRAAVALSFYRMAKDPAKLAKMAEAWGGNQKFRDAVEYNGLNPETMARFGLSEAAYEWGRSNKARVMRGPLGTAMFTLHGYQTRFLSNALKLMKNMGPAGKIAAGWMMAGIWAGAGIEGLPFAQDMENLGDVVWKTLTKHDPMISYRLRDALSQAGLGKIGAEIVMRGPLSTLTGTDVANRIGFGDVLSREWSGITSGTDVLGTVPSIMFGRLAAAWRREQTRQGHAAAAAELLPAALRNPARAAIEADQGLKTQKGKLVTPASKIGPADMTKIGMGFRPLAQERAYEHKDYGYRAKRAHGTVPHDAIPRSGE